MPVVQCVECPGNGEDHGGQEVVHMNVGHNALMGEIRELLAERLGVNEDLLVLRVACYRPNGGEILDDDDPLHRNVCYTIASPPSSSDEDEEDNNNTGDTGPSSCPESFKTADD